MVSSISCAPRERRGKRWLERLCINSDQHGGVEESQGQGDWRDAEAAGEARCRKPTRVVCPSAPERTKYGGRCRDLIGQPECGLEVLIGWEPRACPLARTHFPERPEVADACVP